MQGGVLFVVLVCDVVGLFVVFDASRITDVRACACRMGGRACTTLVLQGIWRLRGLFWRKVGRRL